MEEMPKNYDPSTNEPAILQKWLDGGYYKRREGVGDCTVTIPPPNVTGKLHMGHATDDSIRGRHHSYGPHARQVHALGARYRPRRYRYADQGRQETQERGH